MSDVLTGPGRTQVPRRAGARACRQAPATGVRDVRAGEEERSERHCKPRPAGTARPARSAQGEDGIRVSVSFSDREHGHADYSGPRHARDEFHLGAEARMEFAHNALRNGDGLDEIVAAAAEKIDKDAWGLCDPILEDDGDYDYSNHDVSDAEGSETAFDRGDLRRAILAFLRERHPELAAEL